MSFRRASPFLALSNRDLSGLAQRSTPFRADRYFNEESVADCQELIPVVVAATAFIAIARWSINIVRGIYAHKGAESIAAIGFGCVRGDDDAILGLYNHIGALVA